MRLNVDIHKTKPAHILDHLKSQPDGKRVSLKTVCLLSALILGLFLVMTVLLHYLYYIPSEKQIAVNKIKSYSDQIEKFIQKRTATIQQSVAGFDLHKLLQRTNLDTVVRSLQALQPDFSSIEIINNNGEVLALIGDLSLHQAGSANARGSNFVQVSHSLPAGESQFVDDPQNNSFYLVTRHVGKDGVQWFSRTKFVRKDLVSALNTDGHYRAELLPFSGTNSVAQHRIQSEQVSFQSDYLSGPKRAELVLHQLNLLLRLENSKPVKLISSWPAYIFLFVFVCVSGMLAILSFRKGRNTSRAAESSEGKHEVPIQIAQGQPELISPVPLDSSETVTATEISAPATMQPQENNSSNNLEISQESKNPSLSDLEDFFHNYSPVPICFEIDQVKCELESIETPGKVTELNECYLDSDSTIDSSYDAYEQGHVSLESYRDDGLKDLEMESELVQISAIAASPSDEEVPGSELISINKVDSAEVVMTAPQEKTRDRISDGSLDINTKDAECDVFSEDTLFENSTIAQVREAESVSIHCELGNTAHYEMININSPATLALPAAPHALVSATLEAPALDCEESVHTNRALNTEEHVDKNQLIHTHYHEFPLIDLEYESEEAFVFNLDDEPSEDIRDLELELTLPADLSFNQVADPEALVAAEISHEDIDEILQTDAIEEQSDVLPPIDWDENPTEASKRFDLTTISDDDGSSKDRSAALLSDYGFDDLVFEVILDSPDAQSSDVLPLQELTPDDVALDDLVLEVELESEKIILDAFVVDDDEEPIHADCSAIAPESTTVDQPKEAANTDVLEVKWNELPETNSKEIQPRDSVRFFDFFKF